MVKVLNIKIHHFKILVINRARMNDDVDDGDDSATRDNDYR